MVPINETWKPVVGYEGLYEVSDQGQVRSLPRKGTKGGVLSPGRWRYWLKVSLSSGDKAATYTVHRLVLEAFVGQCPPGLQARHVNGNGFDNRLSNLAWGTPAENSRDTTSQGRHYFGKRTHCSAGHEYTPENTYRRSGKRHCRRCRSEWMTRHRNANPEETP